MILVGEIHESITSLKCWLRLSVIVKKTMKVLPLSSNDIKNHYFHFFTVVKVYGGGMRKSFETSCR